MSSNCCWCNACCCGNDIRRLLTLEELEGLNIERQRGILYADRISQCCPSCQPIRFRSIRQIL